jgi:hypothetical protein
VKNNLLPEVEPQLEEALDKACCQGGMVGSASDATSKSALKSQNNVADNREKWKSASLQEQKTAAKSVET